jgi:hypothetical protein
MTPTTEEDKYSQEDRNRATSFETELLARLGRRCLADVSETELADFRYQANLHVTDRAYQLLRSRALAPKGMRWVREVLAVGADEQTGAARELPGCGRFVRLVERKHAQ